MLKRIATFWIILWSEPFLVWWAALGWAALWALEMLEYVWRSLLQQAQLFYIQLIAYKFGPTYRPTLRFSVYFVHTNTCKRQTMMEIRCLSDHRDHPILPHWHSDAVLCRQISVRSVSTVLSYQNLEKFRYWWLCCLNPSASSLNFFGHCCLNLNSRSGSLSDHRCKDQFYRIRI